MCTSSREDGSAQAKEEQLKQEHVSRGMVCVYVQVCVQQVRKGVAETEGRLQRMSGHWGRGRLGSDPLEPRKALILRFSQKPSLPGHCAEPLPWATTRHSEDFRDVDVVIYLNELRAEVKSPKQTRRQSGKGKP